MSRSWIWIFSSPSGFGTTQSRYITTYGVNNSPSKSVGLLYATGGSTGGNTMYYSGASSNWTMNGNHSTYDSNGNEVSNNSQPFITYNNSTDLYFLVISFDHTTNQSTFMWKQNDNTTANTANINFRTYSVSRHSNISSVGNLSINGKTNLTHTANVLYHYFGIVDSVITKQNFYDLADVLGMV